MHIHLNQVASLLNATTGTGTAVPSRDDRFVVGYVEWGASTSAGVIVIEVARSPEYAGTWSVVATINWSAASKVDFVQVTAPVGAVRARVTTNVVGGTASVYFDTYTG